MTTDLILGTAGHIDHGKTSLVKALTGVDADRLPEEKRRGITIELGFAELVLGDVRLGIVDVPGHERFIRNMLAGATSTDVALLVVAADDSVKPQTREHFEILKLLDLRAGVIALTKCDIADTDWVDLVEAEVRELVAGSFLSSAPIVRTSAVKGTGLESLRRALAEAGEIAARGAGPEACAGPFRMAVDRTFTVAGHGTVVTGSVQSGRAKVGDQLSMEPRGVSVRVRGMQQHDRPVDAVHRGQRAAINLAGVHHADVGRGDELATPGYLVPSRLMTVRLNLLPETPRPLKQRARIRFHVGTAELMATVVLLGVDALPPGHGAHAQLFLSAPAVATWGQPFVIRGQSPAVTLGGGVVLEPVTDKLRRHEPEKLAALTRLEQKDPLERGSAALVLAGWREWLPEDLARACGVPAPDGVIRALTDRGDLVALKVSPSRTRLVHRQVLEGTFAQIQRALARLHQRQPLQAAIDRTAIVRWFAYLGSDALVEAILRRLEEAGRIRSSGSGVALADHVPRLSAGERELLDEIIEKIRLGAFHPPTIAEIRAAATRNRAAVAELAALAAAEGWLVRVSDEIYLHPEHDRRLRELLAEKLAGGQGLTLSQIRGILETTRKYAVPICEYLDRIGFTRREGDVRILTDSPGPHTDAKTP